MQELYNCFKESNSLSDFKERVFENRIQLRFSYDGPLKELIDNELDRDTLMDYLCEIMTRDSHQFIKKQLEFAMERYYADHLNEHLLYEKLAA